MAVHLACRGYQVTGTETNESKTELIRRGKSPFFESQLERDLKKALAMGTLRVCSTRETSPLDSVITFIIVGTPSLRDGSVDLTYLKKAVKNCAKRLAEKEDYSLVVVRSTVPPGTTEDVVKPIIEQYSRKKAGTAFGLAMSPEFLREGSAMHDVAHPDRILIGEYDRRSGDLLEEFNRKVYGSNTPIIRMRIASAELAKYASNAFLATKVSFINQVANLCERIKRIDVVEVARGIGLDPRIGERFLDAGAGWGGSCLPKDTKALVTFSRKLGYRFKLVEVAILVNKLQSRRVVEMAEEELGSLYEKGIAVLGLSFKPNTDDIREATSVRIIRQLLNKKAKLKVYDPLAMENVRALFGRRITYAHTVHDCLKESECCLVLTEWDEFKRLKTEDFITSMKKPIVIDARRIFDPRRFSKKVRLRSIGLEKYREEMA